jgi:hypothetical protein
MLARSEALVDFRFIVHQLVLDANDTVELLFSISENLLIEKLGMQLYV